MYIHIDVYTYRCIYIQPIAIRESFFFILNLNRWSSCLGLFCHVPLKRDQWDRDWRLRINNTSNAIGCILNAIDCPCFTTIWICMCSIVLSAAYCNRNVMSWISSLNRWSSPLCLLCSIWKRPRRLRLETKIEGHSRSRSLGLFGHALLRTDQWDPDWRLRLNDTSISIDDLVL